MEDAVPLSRLIAASASFFLLLTATLTSATAQSAPGGTAGQPMPLLQFVHHKTFVPHKSLAPHRSKVSRAKERPHPKVAEKLTIKRPVRHEFAKRVFAKPRKVIAAARPVPVHAAVSTPVQNIWPTVHTVAPADNALLTPDRTPGPVTTVAVVDTDPNQIVAGSHSVQAALPTGLNANAVTPDPVKNVASAPVKKVAKTQVPVPSAAKPVVHAMVVKALRANGPATPIGSASWIAHVLAALGGAIAAGAVAWVLIRPAPERNYG